MRNILLICFTLSSLAAMAQGPQVVLPWTPAPDTNHIRTIRNYDYDTVTLERKLASTCKYDRHGYMVGALDSVTYNEQGLLSRWVSGVLHCNTENPKGWVETESIWDIRYSSDGVIQHASFADYDRVYRQNGYMPDTSIDTYDLLSYKVHPAFGLLDYTCKHCYSSSSRNDNSCDTLFFRREYDDHGRLLHQYTNCDYAPDDITYHYRADGRVEYRVGYYYEWSDSLYYHYDDHGVLTHMTGKEYDLGMEADVYIRCQPDGRRIEARLLWHVYGDDEGVVDDGTTEIQEYDSRGLLLRCRIEGHKVPSYECEIDYWE